MSITYTQPADPRAARINVYTRTQKPGTKWPTIEFETTVVPDVIGCMNSDHIMYDDGTTYRYSKDNKTRGSTVAATAIFVRIGQNDGVLLACKRCAIVLKRGITRESFSARDLSLAYEGDAASVNAIDLVALLRNAQRDAKSKAEAEAQTRLDSIRDAWSQVRADYLSDDVDDVKVGGWYEPAAGTSVTDDYGRSWVILRHVEDGQAMRPVDAIALARQIEEAALNAIEATNAAVKP